MEVFESIAGCVGNTPIVSLSRFGRDLNHNLLAKCEFLNPGGSVKDRIAFFLVDRAERDGRLSPGGTIVEATAGNTGIGLAMVCALKGYKLITVLSEKVSQDKVKLLKTLGAEVVVVPVGKAITDPDHAMNRARAIAAAKGAWLADQFYNRDNILAHYEITGPEIWAQTAGKIDALVAGVGTGGTLSGAGRFLKERNPSIKIVLADPTGSILAEHTRGAKTNSGPYIVEGIGGDFIPGNFDVELVDCAYQITDDEAVGAAHQLMKQEAIFVGSSSGCIAAASVRFCQDLDGERKNVVAILPDGGRGYMSTIYDDAWLRTKLKKAQSTE